jgi:Leucine-rich repeat (LRR) protein
MKNRLSIFLILLICNSVIAQGTTTLPGSIEINKSDNKYLDSLYWELTGNFGIDWHTALDWNYEIRNGDVPITESDKRVVISNDVSYAKDKVTKILFKFNKYNSNVASKYLFKFDSLKILDLDSNNIDSFSRTINNRISHYLFIDNNKLNFDELIYINPFVNYLTANNQQKVTLKDTVDLFIGDKKTIYIPYLGGNLANHNYDWYRDHKKLNNYIEGDSSYFINYKLYSDTGSYWANATYDGISNANIPAEAAYIKNIPPSAEYDDKALKEIKDSLKPNLSSGQWPIGALNHHISPFWPGVFVEEYPYGSSKSIVDSINLTDYNLVGKIPYNIRYLGKLKHLILKNNKINQLTESMNYFHYIESVDLSKNRLTFYELEKLLYLNKKIGSKFKYNDQDTNYNAGLTQYRTGVKWNFNKLTDSILPIDNNPFVLKFIPKLLSKNNQYKWYWKFKDETNYRDLSSFSETDSLSVELFNKVFAPYTLQMDTSINIFAEIKNDSLKNLTLYSDTLNIKTQTSLFSDSVIFVNLYHSTAGPKKWTTKINFSSNFTTWPWIGFKDNRLASINLSNNNLDSVIPLSIINLDSLLELNLSNNSIDSVCSRLLELPIIDTINLEANNLNYARLEEIENIHNYVDSYKNQLINYTNQKYDPLDSVYHSFNGNYQYAINSKNEIFVDDNKKKIYIYLDTAIHWNRIEITETAPTKDKDETVIYTNFEIQKSGYNTYTKNRNHKFKFWLKNYRFPKLEFIDSFVVRTVGSTHGDILALNEIFNFNNGVNWNISNPACIRWNHVDATIENLKQNKWCGITTIQDTLSNDSIFTRVKKIDLTNYNLTGSFGDYYLENLDLVETLILDSNNLEGFNNNIYQIGNRRYKNKITNHEFIEIEDFALDSLSVVFNKLDYSSIDKLLKHPEFNIPQDYIDHKYPYDKDNKKIDGYFKFSPQKSAPITIHRDFDNVTTTLTSDDTVHVMALTTFDVSYDKTKFNPKVRVYQFRPENKTPLKPYYNTTNINYYSITPTYVVARDTLMNPSLEESYNNETYSSNYINSSNDDTLSISTPKAFIKFFSTRYSDSLALVYFNKSTGEKMNWNYNDSINKWDNIGLTNTGRVDSIKINDSTLVGYLPIELVTIDSLRYFDISNKGSNPNKFNNVYSAYTYNVNYLQPQSTFESRYKHISNKIFLTNFKLLDTFNISNNQFYFDALEQFDHHFYKNPSFIYWPQNYNYSLTIQDYERKLINNDTITDIALYSIDTLEAINNSKNISPIDPSANFSWRNDTSRSTSYSYTNNSKNSVKFEFTNLDSFEFYTQIANSGFDKLVFYTDTIRINSVRNLKSDSLALVDFASHADGGYWIGRFSPHNVPGETYRKTNKLEDWYGVSLTPDKSRIDSINIRGLNIVGKITHKLYSMNKLRYLLLDNNKFYHIDTSYVEGIDHKMANLFKDGELKEVGLSHNSFLYNDFFDIYNYFGNESDFADTVLYFPQDTKIEDTVIAVIDNKKHINYSSVKVACNDSIVWNINNSHADKAEFYVNSSKIEEKVHHNNYSFNKQLDFSLTPDTLKYILKSNTFTQLEFPNTCVIKQRTSRISDSLFLVDLYHSTKGANWVNNNNWLTVKKLEQWHGVQIKNDRLHTLDLRNNNLDSLITQKFNYLDSTHNILLNNNSIDSISSEAYIRSDTLTLGLSDNQIQYIHNDLFKQYSYSPNYLKFSIDSNYLDFEVLENLNHKFYYTSTYLNQYSFYNYKNSVQNYKIGYKKSDKIICPIPDKAKFNTVKWEIWKSNPSSPADSIRKDENTLAPIYRDSALVFKMDSLWNVKNVDFFKDTFKLFAEIRNIKVPNSSIDVDGYDTVSGNFYRFLVANINFKKDKSSDSIAALVIKDSIQYKNYLVGGFIKKLVNNRYSKLNYNTNFYSVDTVVKGKVPKIIAEMDSLKYLDFYGNNIHFIPDELANIKTLKEINLGKNKLSDIEFKAWKFTHLDSLNLSENYFTFEDLLPVKDSIENYGNFEMLIYRDQIYSDKDTINNDSLRRGFNTEMVARLVDEENKYIAILDNGIKQWELEKTKNNPEDTVFYDYIWNFPDDTIKMEICAYHTDLPQLKLDVRYLYYIDYQGSNSQDLYVLSKIKDKYPSLTPWSGNNLANYPGVSYKNINGEDRVTGIDLSHKGLTGEFPSEIMDLVKLEDLILNNNNLDHISDSIKYLYPKLRNINIKNNNISTINHSFDWIDSAQTFIADSNHLNIATSISSLDSIFKRTANISLSMNKLDYKDMSTLYTTFIKHRPAQTNKSLWMPQDTIGTVTTYQGDLRIIEMHTGFNEPSVGTTTYEWEKVNTLSSGSEALSLNDSTYNLQYSHSDSGWYYISANNDLLGRLEHHYKRVIHPPKIFGDDYYEAFKDLYNALDRGNSEQTNSWGDTVYNNFNINNFEGIKIKFGRITSIKLDSLKMEGTVPASFNRLWDMDTVILSNNNIDMDVQSLRNFKNLTHLDIHRTNINSLPELIDAKELKTLDASFSNISTHKDSKLAVLPNIEKIDLSNNSFDIAPSLSFSSNKIKEIKLANNNIDNVEIFFYSNFDSLKSLDISNNRIANDIETLKMPQIEYLNISDNNISNFNLSDASKLKELHVHNNKLSEIPIGPNLTHIVAYNNEINSADLSSLKDIEILNLAWNNLDSIKLDNLYKIRGVILNNNKLTKISFNNIFNQHNTLEKVHLHNNNLDSLPIEFLSANFISVQNNYLTFNDLMAFKDKENLGYAPQKTIGNLDTLVLDSGQLAQVKIDSQINHIANKYTWFYYETKVNETEFNNSNRDLIFDPSYNPIIHEGVYYYKVKNDSLPKLTLESAITLVKTKEIINNESKDGDGVIENNSDVKIKAINPNPFYDQLTIEYVLNKDSRLNISVYNSNGKKVATIHNGYSFSGSYIEELNGIEQNLNYGLHFIVFTTENKKLIVKVMFLNN